MLDIAKILEDETEVVKVESVVAEFMEATADTLEDEIDAAKIKLEVAY